MRSSLIIGSRGSKLALTQAEWVKAKLALHNPSLELAIKVIKTSGDVRSDPLSVIGGKGVFSKELEDALMEERIDIAVHSLKDLPTVIPESLAISAICERADPRDALVINREIDIEGLSIRSLPMRAVIGTSSPRRMAQLKHLRSDIVIKELRGNIDTRLRKLDEGQYDALIVAAAGLCRLGLEKRIGAAIPLEQMLPAVGQGAIAIESRAADKGTIDTTRSLDHEATRMACEAERALLRSLGGGCQLPVGGHAVVYYQQLRIEGLIADPAGKQIIRDHVNGATSEAVNLGAELGERLLRRGADQLLNFQ